MSSQEVALSGHTLSSSDMSAIADLRNDTAFPTFDSCPSEYDIDLEYYHSIDGLFLVPTRHWCLLAEILGASLIIRLRLVVKDKVGKRFPIAFHLEPDDTGLNPLDFRKGYTVAILYPHQHRFLDFTEGIRQDDIKRIQVIPLSLSDILDLSDRVQTQNRQIDGKYGCHACGTRKESLMKCGKCGLARYCDKDCQVKGWKEMGHKEDCKVLKDIHGLFTMDWNDFEKFAEFPLGEPILLPRILTQGG